MRRKAAIFASGLLLAVGAIFSTIKTFSQGIKFTSSDFPILRSGVVPIFGGVFPRTLVKLLQRVDAQLEKEPHDHLGRWVP